MAQHRSVVRSLVALCLLSACGTTAASNGGAGPDLPAPDIGAPGPDLPPDLVVADTFSDTSSLDVGAISNVEVDGELPDLADGSDAVSDVGADAELDAEADLLPDLPAVDVGADVTASCADNAACASLDDGDLCNGSYACVAGSCQFDPQSVVVCPATAPGVCQAWQCLAATGQCSAVPVLAGTACDDGIACTNADVCGAGPAAGCVGTPGSGCPSDANPCTVDLCDPAQGGCIHVPAAASAPCDDGDLCTTGDACDPAGQCAGIAKACSGSQGPCWTATCDPTSGACVATALSATPCDDGLVCTKNDTCTAGTCAGTPLVCTNSNPCVTVACNPVSGGCTPTNLPAGTPCDVDGNACTQEACTTGNCLVVQTTTNCAPDGNACTDDVCHPATGCYADIAPGGACDDGDACTHPDTCTGGSCAGLLDLAQCPQAKLTACPPKSIIQVQSQTLTGKLSLPVAAPLQAGGATRAAHGLKMPASSPTVPTQWVQVEVTLAAVNPPASPIASVSVGEVSGSDCSVSVPVTFLPSPTGGIYEWPTQASKTYWMALDLDPAIYASGATLSGFFTVHTADINGFCDQPADCSKIACATKVCSDGDGCTVGDTCVGGVCQPSGPKLCAADSNPCTVDACNPKTGNCGISLPDGAPCDDANPCTTADACTSTLCKGSAKVCVDDKNPCTLDYCEGTTGACNFAAADGSYCSDGNACTAGDACLAGSCKGGSLTQCPGDSNPCTADVCDPASGTCGKPLADGTACEDGNLCTAGDTCAYGYCQAGNAVICKNDKNACTIDSCDYKTGTCYLPVADGTWCDDQNACTDGDKCKVGKCQAGPPLGCNDNNTCTADLCAPAVGCQNLASIQQLVPIVDGSIGSDWIGVMPSTLNGQSSDWGVGLNELHAVYLAQDATWLYVAADGFVEPGNAIVGYIDTDFGSGSGVGDFSTLTDSSGALDDALSNAMFMESSDFGADVAFGTVGMASCANLEDAAGWRSLKPTSDLPWLPGQLQATPTGFEARIALATLYPAGMPAGGTSLAVVLRIVNAGGSSLSNQVLPQQWFSDGTPGVPNAQPFALLTVGACDDGNACTDGDVCSFGNCQGQSFTCADTGNPCTIGQCTPATGCAPAPLSDGVPCSNSAGCTDADSCKAGVCVEGKCP